MWFYEVVLGFNAGYILYVSDFMLIYSIPKHENHTQLINRISNNIICHNEKKII